MGWEVGGDICIPMANSCDVWKKPTKYCKEISFQLKINLKNESTYILKRLFILLPSLLNLMALDFYSKSNVNLFYLG